MPASTNTIPAGLKLTKVLDSAMKAFKRGLAPLRAITTVFQANPLQGTDKIAVPYYGLYTTASETRAPGGSVKALAKDTATGIREITLNKNKIQVLSFTAETRARQPIFDPITHGDMMGDQLAQDVMADILSLAVPGTFPGESIDPIAMADFDSTELYDLQSLCDDANWPEAMRSAILRPRLYSGVARSQATLDWGRNNDPDVYREGKAPNVAGFDLYKTTGIPHNDEDVIGMVVHPSAILAAFAPVEPGPALRAQYYDHQIIVDEDSGLTFEYCEFADPDTREVVQSIECNYGYAAGEAAAMKLIIEAEGGSGS